MLAVYNPKASRRNLTLVAQAGDVREYFDTWIQQIRSYVEEHMLWNGPVRNIRGHKSVQYVFIQTPIRVKELYIEFEQMLYSSSFVYLEETNKPWCFLLCWDYIVVEMSLHGYENPAPNLCSQCYTSSRLQQDPGMVTCLCQHYIDWCREHPYCQLQIPNDAPIIALRSKGEPLIC